MLSPSMPTVGHTVSDTMVKRRQQDHDATGAEANDAMEAKPETR